MDYKDYYKTLGVSPKASADEIRSAYRKLARKYHPDINTGDKAEAKFKDVNEAYEVLKDPERRAAYDQLGKEPAGGRGFRPPPEWDGGYSFSGVGPESGEGFSDFFETLFRRGGGRASGFEGDFGGGRGRDSHARIEIDIADAYRGATRQLNLQTPVMDDQGRMRMETRTISVTIPKGIRAGQHLRLAGQGDPALGGGAAGDLFLEITFAPHPVYHVEGSDLFLDLPVAPWEAALGGKVVMPTPGGKVSLNIPRNARSGQKMRLKGKGLPGTPPGDIYATLRIVNPKATTAEARALFERMAKEMPFDPRSELKG